MKPAFRDIESFVKRPNPAARVILVYGPDDGLMRERSRTIGLSAVADLNDPFNVAILSGDVISHDPARLADEANAMSMMGGGRLVRIENAGDKITAAVKIYLENPSPHALVVIEAGELGARSSLRSLCEKSPNAAALPCYVEDERAVAALVREMTAAENMRMQPDALAWLCAAIAGDRGRARREIEKLILYKFNDPSPVSLEDARACCGDSGKSSLDDLVYKTAGREAKAAMAAYARLMGEGVAFVSILRALQNHFRRLHAARARMEDGASAQEAVKALAPPVFFKLEDSFRGQLHNWSTAAIEKTLLRLLELEAACKRTGAPVETLCAQAVMGISAARA